MAGIGMGIGGIASSTTFYHTLSKDFTDDIKRVAKSLVALQDQLDSLAEVDLQNKRGLDLLTAEKRGLCLFLNEECYFYVNQSEIIRDMAQQLREWIIKRREELANSWGNWNNIWSWASWLLPLAGPLFMFFVVLLFGSCILNAVTQFITSWIESVKLQPPKQWGALNVLPKHEMMLSTTSDRSIKLGNEEEKLKFYLLLLLPL